MNPAMPVLRLRTAAVLLLSVGVLAACAGENLFQIAAVGGETKVEILAPEDGSTVPFGDQLEVEARVTVPAGGADVEFIGVHPGDDATAFSPEEVNVTGLLVVELNAVLNPANSQQTGEALIIVTATTVDQEQVADTISVTVTQPN